MTNEPRPDVVAIRTPYHVVVRGDDQMFYETKKTWQLWQETPRLYFVGRWNKRDIFDVYTEEGNPMAKKEPTVEEEDAQEQDQGNTHKDNEKQLEAHEELADENEGGQK